MWNQCQFVCENRLAFPTHPFNFLYHYCNSYFNLCCVYLFVKMDKHFFQDLYHIVICIVRYSLLLGKVGGILDNTYLSIFAYFWGLCTVCSSQFVKTYEELFPRLKITFSINCINLCSFLTCESRKGLFQDIFIKFWYFNNFWDYWYCSSQFVKTYEELKFIHDFILMLNNCISICLWKWVGIFPRHLFLYFRLNIILNFRLSDLWKPLGSRRNTISYTLFNRFKIPLTCLWK